MYITILTMSSRGDVQPFIALALGLPPPIHRAESFRQLDTCSAPNTCLHGGKLLKALTYRAMITPTPSAKRSHRWGVLGYGYGIQVSDREGLQELSHSGYVPGYISTLIYYPKQLFSVVVLENTAWLTNDISRVFSVHDRLREIIRNRSANL